MSGKGGFTSVLGGVGAEDPAGSRGSEVVAGNGLAVAPVQHQLVAVFFRLEAENAIISTRLRLRNGAKISKGRMGKGGETHCTVSPPLSAEGLFRAGWGCGRAGTAARRDSVEGFSSLNQLMVS